MIGGNAGSFGLLQTDVVQAPENARSVRVRLMFRPASGASATAYFDDVSFSTASAPTDAPVPTRTPSSPPPPTVGGKTATPRPTSGATDPPGSTEPLATDEPNPDEPIAFDALVNGGFEEAREDGTPFGWHKVGGSFAVSPANRASGDLALQLTSDTTSTKWAYQSVVVTPGAYYRATAWALNASPGDQLILRISWYATSDGEGSAISDVDAAAVVTGAASGFRQLDTGAVRAPNGAHSARVRLLLRPSSAGQTQAFFDDVTFDGVAAPAGGGGSGDGHGGRGGVTNPTGGSSETGGQGEGLVAGVTTNGPVHNGGPEIGAVAGASQSNSGGSSDWLLALAIGVPVIGISGVLGVPYLRRKIRRPE